MVVIAVALLGGEKSFDKHQVTPSENRYFAALNLDVPVSFALILKVFCFIGSGVVVPPWCTSTQSSGGSSRNRIGIFWGDLYGLLTRDLVEGRTDLLVPLETQCLTVQHNFCAVVVYW
jgi:hypothetical protein